MGVLDKEWKRSVLEPPRLETACAAADGRLALELVDRRAPELPTAIAARAQQVLFDTRLVARHDEVRVLEGIEPPHRVSRGDPDHDEGGDRDEECPSE